MEYLSLIESRVLYVIDGWFIAYNVVALDYGRRPVASEDVLSSVV